jgi:hypothetical protein
MKGEIPITTIIGVVAVLLLLIIGFYYLYTNVIPSQKTLTEQQCDVLLKTACDSYKKQVQKNPKEAFKGVPEGCVGKELLDDCKEGNTNACEIICEVGEIGEPGGMGESSTI